VLPAEPPSLALGKAHATRRESDSFISLDAKGVHMTGIKKAEDSDEMVIRLVEVEGKEKIFTLTLPENVESARIINFVEMPINDKSPMTIKGNSITAKINPHQILTLAIKFK
jgi:alpha-mannosidase